MSLSGSVAPLKETVLLELSLIVVPPVQLMLVALGALLTLFTVIEKDFAVLTAFFESLAFTSKVIVVFELTELAVIVTKSAVVIPAVLLKLKTLLLILLIS